MRYRATVEKTDRLSTKDGVGDTITFYVKDAANLKDAYTKAKLQGEQVLGAGLLRVHVEEVEEFIWPRAAYMQH